MLFELDENQVMIRDLVSRFGEEHLRDRRGELSSILRQLADVGMMGFSAPASASGSELGPGCITVAFEELGRHSPSIALALAFHNFGALECLLQAGASHDTLSAIIEAGDLLGWAQCQSVDISNDIVSAEVGSLFAAELVRGLVLYTGEVVAYVDAVDLRVGRRRQTLGFHPGPSLATIVNASAGVHALQDFRDSHLKLALASIATGIASYTFEKGRDYANEREQFGRPIRSFQAIQFKLADMATELMGARLLNHRAADALERGRKDAHRLAHLAWMHAPRVAYFVADEALQLHGGYGYTVEYEIESYLRDAISLGSVLMRFDAKEGP